MTSARAVLLALVALMPWPVAAQDMPAAAQDMPPAAQDMPAAITDPAAPPVAETPAIPAAPPSLPDKLGAVPGTWDLSRDGTNRRCVMTLQMANGEAGRRLAFPAGCRRALPVMSGVAGWLFVDGAVRLVDRNVRPILDFTRRPDQRSLVARTEGGERYSLVPLDIAAMRPAGTAGGLDAEADAPASGASAPGPSGPVGASPSPFMTPSPTSSAAIEAPGPGDGARAAVPDGPAPGDYAIDRFQERDTCRITLDAIGNGVHVVPGCHDGGVELFDPVRWQFTKGRLRLTAKRGHSFELVPTGDGRWRRDPEVGTTFVLRRVDGPAAP